MDGLKLNDRKRTPWVCVGFEAETAFKSDRLLG
jgi:hypothetical protein